MFMRFAVVLPCFALIGCEQGTQRLPFDADIQATATITAQGGSLSTPAGAAIHFRPGSLASPLQVTLVPVGSPAAPAQFGTSDSQSFRIEPVGTVLTKPAELELKMTTRGGQAWLASIVTVTNGQVVRTGSTRVDLSTGIVSGSVGQLGTVGVVIPDSKNIHRVQLRPSLSFTPTLALSSATTDSVSISCGGLQAPCDGVSASASQNLLDQVEEAVVLYPAATGVLRLRSGPATGRITATASLRILMRSGQTAESVEIEALLEPTASTVVTETATEIHLSHVRHRIGGGGSTLNGAQEDIQTLVIPKSGSTGMVTIRRSFQIRTAGGALQTAQVTIGLPLRIHF
jgi:hypothetical protein